METSLLHQAALFLSTSIHADDRYLLADLFDQVVFNKHFFRYVSLLMIMNINDHTTRALPEFIDNDTIPPGFTSLHEFLDTYTTWVVSIQKKYIGSK